LRGDGLAQKWQPLGVGAIEQAREEPAQLGEPEGGEKAEPDGEGE
jgi:hypothetical protein